MARRAKKKEANDNRVIVETTRKCKVECLPISTLLDEIEAATQAKRDAIEWPTYPFIDVGGSEIQLPYTEKKILEADEQTQERYRKCKDELAQIEDERNENVFKALALRGTHVVDGPSEDTWVQEHEFMGLSVPEHPFERTFHFFKTEVIGGTSDAITIIAGIYRASGVNEEDLATFEASFRATLETSERDDATPDTAETGEDKPE